MYDHNIIQSEIQKHVLVNGVYHNIYFWWIDPHAIVETVYVLHPLKLYVQGG